MVAVCLIVFAGAGGCARRSPSEIASPTEVAILWLDEGRDVDGVKVKVGRRLEEAPETGILEPVVSLTHEGKPVADAMVFVQLVTAGGEGASGEEAACVYEAASGCYSPGKLKMPEKVGDLAIRTRIIFAGVEQEWTGAVPFSLQSSAGSH